MHGDGIHAGRVVRQGVVAAGGYVMIHQPPPPLAELSGTACMGYLLRSAHAHMMAQPASCSTRANSHTGNSATNTCPNSAGWW